MPRFDAQNHKTMLDAGYEFDSNTDRYFNRGQPVWEEGLKIEEGRRQGAFPSRTLDEFRAQEDQWIVEQKAKIRAMKASATTEA